MGKEKFFYNIKLYLYCIFFQVEGDNSTFLRSKHCENCDTHSSLIMSTLQAGATKLILN